MTGEYIRCRAGFTLIEISIVLIILGLLSTGILVGREIIQAAEVRKEVRLLTETESAVRAFRLKYNALPGDFSQRDIIDGVDPNHYGDGDGFIRLRGDAYDGIEEYMYTWEHLSRSQLIEGHYDGGTGSPNFPFQCLPEVSCPPTGFGGKTSHYLMGGMGAYAGDLYGSYLANSDENIGIVIANSAEMLDIKDHLTVWQAHGLDTKLDDGIAHSGRTFGKNATVDGRGCVNGSTDMTDGSGDYNYAMKSKARECIVIHVIR